MSEVVRPQDESVIDHYAFVRCHGDSVPGQQSCGLVGLTYGEYPGNWKNRTWVGGVPTVDRPLTTTTQRQSVRRE